MRISLKRQKGFVFIAAAALAWQCSDGRRAAKTGQRPAIGTRQQQDE